MACSSGSGASCGSYSESQQQMMMEERKRKRLVSNWESARPSRTSKHQHLDDLMAQSSRLKNDNIHIITTIDITARLYLDVEAENAVLRVQMAELINRLQSLNQVIDFINSRKRNQLFGDIGDAQINDFGFIRPAPVNQRSWHQLTC
ncbi:bZIP transcription factor 11-like [Neltuma alba]|uniref:bZIP transcription factor 11-like n=1 Tax=Neltuma alba TaxID=207710 RepID=UPI0010A34BFD|nr:bZIP transcription factor 11-like [Prosopis alba]